MRPSKSNLDADALTGLLAGRSTVVVAGAGCSTGSGIPDYRSPAALRRKRRPIQYNEFVREPHIRARYWARSALGWPKIEAAEPNAVHRALARLEAAGVVNGIITQNVDRLHHKAGSRRVLELHGALADVRCLDCHVLESRGGMQRRLFALNPGVALPDHALPPGQLAPDGDAILPDDLAESIRVPECLACGGLLKPDVVFFGENVPRRVVDEAWAMVDEADAMLVVGSSLTVWSGYRFVRGADERGMPIAIVNRGPTRGDPHATVRLDAQLEQVLPAAADLLAG